MQQDALRPFSKITADRGGVLPITRARAYALVREGIFPPGVVVRLGRSYFYSPSRLEAFLEGGGKGFAGGWRREAQ